MLSVLLEQTRLRAVAPYGGQPRKMARSLPYFSHRYRASRPMYARCCRISEKSYDIRHTACVLKQERTGEPVIALPLINLAVPDTPNREQAHSYRPGFVIPENTKATRRWPLSIRQ